MQTIKYTNQDGCTHYTTWNNRSTCYSRTVSNLGKIVYVFLGHSTKDEKNVKAKRKKKLESPSFWAQKASLQETCLVNSAHTRQVKQNRRRRWKSSGNPVWHCSHPFQRTTPNRRRFQHLCWCSEAEPVVRSTMLQDNLNELVSKQL